MNDPTWPVVNHTVRVRINVSVSTRGVKTWDSTIELSGSNDEIEAVKEEALAQSDSLVAALDKRYPPPEA